MSLVSSFSGRTNELEAEKDVQSEKITNVFARRWKALRSEIEQMLLAMTFLCLSQLQCIGIILQASAEALSS